MPIPAKAVTINCPLCERSYALHGALLHSAFACMNCGTLIRASGMIQPDLKPPRPEKVEPSRRDTQTFSSSDTVQFERPEVPPVQELDDLPSGQPARTVKLRGRKKDDSKLLTLASIVAVCGAVAILLVVVVAMSLARSPTRIPAPQPVAQPLPAVKHETKAQTAEKDLQTAWVQAEKLKLAIAANKAKVERLQVALREATTKHFADAQRDLEAARTEGRELVEREALWRAEYVKRSKELGK